MRGRLWLLMVAALALVSQAFAGSSPTLTTARLDFDYGTCSGTVVGPQTILTAGHCLKEEENELGFEEPPPDTMKVDGYKVTILAVVFDEADHALVKTDFVFKDWSKISRPPPVSAVVHYWGNPDGISHVYREGYVTSYTHGAMVMDVNGFFGDSGSGIFDEDGDLVGVMSFIQIKKYNGLLFRLMGAYPLEFTPLQYAMMGVVAP